jgi:hypothetical protein
MDECLIPADIIFNCILPYVRAFDQLIWKRVCKRWYNEMKQKLSYSYNFWTWKYDQKMTYVVYVTNKYGRSIIVSVQHTFDWGFRSFKEDRYRDGDVVHFEIIEHTNIPPFNFCKECGLYTHEAGYEVEKSVVITYRKYPCKCPSRENMVLQCENAVFAVENLIRTLYYLRLDPFWDSPIQKEDPRQIRKNNEEIALKNIMAQLDKWRASSDELQTVYLEYWNQHPAEKKDVFTAYFT